MNNNIVGINGQPVPIKELDGIYHIRICLIGADDIDIKNVDTFGMAEDGFFMVKSLDNKRFPVFMTSPTRIKTIEIYKDGKKPMTKLSPEKGNDDFIVDLLRKKNETESKT